MIDVKTERRDTMVDSLDLVYRWFFGPEFAFPEFETLAFQEHVRYRRVELCAG